MASPSGTNGRVKTEISAGFIGAQWRDWRGANGIRVDQIDKVISEIKENPSSRRLIVSAWNPAEIDGNGVTAMSRAFPILRQRRRAQLSALSA